MMKNHRTNWYTVLNRTLTSLESLDVPCRRKNGIGNYKRGAILEFYFVMKVVCTVYGKHNGKSLVSHNMLFSTILCYQDNLCRMFPTKKNR